MRIAALAVAVTSAADAGAAMESTHAQKQGEGVPSKVWLLELEAGGCFADLAKTERHCLQLMGATGGVKITGVEITPSSTHLRHDTRSCQKKAQQLQESCHGALRELLQGFALTRQVVNILGC